MGEIRPKKCEGRELTKDQLAADSNNPGAARAALMAAAYGDAVDDWESQVTEVQGRMSKILSSTIDERALAASRESLGGKSPEGGAEKSRAVRCFSAPLATRPGASLLIAWVLCTATSRSRERRRS